WLGRTNTSAISADFNIHTCRNCTILFTTWSATLPRITTWRLRDLQSPLACVLPLTLLSRSTHFQGSHSNSHRRGCGKDSALFPGLSREQVALSGQQRSGVKGVLDR